MLRQLQTTGFAAILGLATCLVAPTAHSAGGDGGGGIGSPTASSAMPSARSHYKAGLRHKNKALRAQEKAAEATTEKKREKQLARAQREFRKAAERMSATLQMDNDHADAANELGFALRNMGDYARALKAYNYALQLRPDFLEAMEYRGEALLALGYPDETRKIYLRLFRDDPSLAAQLMTAIEAWLAENPDKATEEFANWVAERRGLVGFATGVGQDRHW